MRPHLRHLRSTLLLLVSAALLSTTASADNLPRINLDHYSGTWLEIARRPMFLTNGCVAGFSRYRLGKIKGAVAVEDGCRVGTPSGKLKTVSGDGRIIDFGETNSRMRVKYPFLIVFDYWVLYKSDDQSWFISADQHMHNLWIFSRNVPSKQRLQKMVKKASELGYDVSKLEFPAQLVRARSKSDNRFQRVGVSPSGRGPDLQQHANGAIGLDAVVTINADPYEMATT